MKPYRALFRIRFANSLQYRAAAIAGLTTQFAWGFMYILGFAAFYSANPYAFPMTFQQTVSYIWLQQAFMAMFFMWNYEYSIFDSIESGSISYELVRPMDLYSRWFTTTTANRLSRTVLRCFPILIVAFILPAPFRMVLPAEAVRIGLFFISMVLSLGVVVSFSMLVYISAFFTVNSAGTRIAVGVAGDFLAGGYIPVPFFPDALRFAVELSPFGAMQNMPLLIFNGGVTGDALVRGLLLQVFWLVALVFVGRVLMSRALRKVVVQGG
ncbi:MAG: ABC transporter permease [Defluviitaleaceae bacterium]|nr:ABC transporter permease [Defluviitaleaceae bacterium]MCL2263669.1 ABC transporter permease [Defluviitaleaceae bacterium]